MFIVRTGKVGVLTWFAGGFGLPNPTAVSLYWLVALISGYVATAVLFALRARRLGVATSPWPFVLSGIGLLGFWIAFAAIGHQLPGDLFIRGFTPLIPMGVGLFALAWIERSRALALFAGAFVALAFVVNLYDLENLFSRIHVSVPTPQIGLIAPGAMLLAGAAAFWLVDRARS